MPSERHNELVKNLVKLGNILGYRTYSYDKQGKYYYDKLPKTLDTESLTFVEQIDVIWFNLHNYPVYAFEVELSSGVTSGFSRLYQLRHFTCQFYIVIDNDSDNFLAYRNKFDKLTTSDPYLEVEEHFNLIESEDLFKLVALSEQEYNLKKGILGMKVDFYEEGLEIDTSIPTWVDGGSANFSKHFPESKALSKQLFEMMILQFKSNKEDINLKCQIHWISVYKRNTLIFYVYVRKDKLLFDSKFSDEYEEDIHLDKIERPESAHIIPDTTYFYAVKEENEIPEILKLLEFSYSKLG